MVCDYIENCKSCGNHKKWFCKALIPKKRIMDKAFCIDPVESDCAVYKRAIESDKK